MPWLVTKKTLLVLKMLGYVDYMHWMVPKISRLSRKFARLVRQDVEYVGTALVRGVEEIAL